MVKCMRVIDPELYEKLFAVYLKSISPNQNRSNSITAEESFTPDSIADVINEEVATDKVKSDDKKNVSESVKETSSPQKQHLEHNFKGDWLCFEKFVETTHKRRKINPKKKQHNMSKTRTRKQYKSSR